jgi:serine/threonine protein kinase/WD40 repeat protein/Tfp pilus assembly protein PilF
MGDDRVGVVEMASQAPERHPVEELAEGFLERYRRGERPALSEYTQKYPELAEEILELFPALAMMEEVVPGSADGRHAQKSGIAANGPEPEQIGEYRIVREVGRGGMGIVYEAEQEALGRHVALKVLPFQMASDTVRLQRFRREARSAARLHHTNIVPVFDVGCHEGIHYYAMQFIRGQGLDQVILELQRLRGPVAPFEQPSVAGVRELARSLASGAWGENERVAPSKNPPTDPVMESQDRSLADKELKLAPTVPISAPAPLMPEQATPLPAAPKSHSDFSAQSDFHYYRSVARLGVQVAEALAYAHGQNILHRDIKPANLLLDQQGTVWVTDFGLAKEQGSDLTQTGDLVGTLRYMAPERFKGISDVRSDVYGLGLTLYELVTQRAAFADSDRARLISRVTKEEPVRPRKWDRHVPRDLETIILKAMAKEPEQRYRSAAALAEDLRRFLADRPIKARRTSTVEQAWRWCRRNPVVASLLGIISVLILGFSLATLGKNAELSQTLADQEEANRQATVRLWESLRDRARALRSSGQPGQRIEAIRSIHEAMQLPLPAGHSLSELRTEAIAALPLVDLEVLREWSGAPPGAGQLVFDPRSEHYARLDRDGTIGLRRVADDCLLATWREEGFSLGGFYDRAMTLSPDGRTIAVMHADSHRLRVRRIEGSEAVLCYEASQVFSSAQRVFTPDGSRLIYGLQDGSIALFDVAGKTVRYLPNKVKNLDSLQIDADGKRLAFTCTYDNRPCLEIRDLESGRLQTRIFPSGKTSNLAWHPSGFFLACVVGQQIHVFDLISGKLIHTLLAHKTGGVTIAIDWLSGLLVSNDWSGLLRIWDPLSGEQVLCIGAPNFPLLSGNFEGTIPAHKNSDMTVLQLYRLSRSPILRNLRRPTGPEPGGYASGPEFARTSPDGRLLAIGARDENEQVFVSLIEISTGREVALLPNQESPVHWDDDGSLMTCGRDGLLSWPLRADQADSGHLTIGPPTLLLDYRTFNLVFAASKDGRLIVIPKVHQGALLWNRNDPSPRTVLGDQREVRYTAVSPDGHWVATGCHTSDRGKTAKVWDASTGKAVHFFEGSDMCHVQFSTDNRWLYTSNDGRLWHVGTWEPGPVVGGPGACFAPDGKIMAVEGNLASIQLILPDTGEEIARLETPIRGRRLPSCFTTDGLSLIASDTESRQLDIWDLHALRRELAALGLDWEGPPTEQKNPRRWSAPSQSQLNARVVPGPRVGADVLVLLATELGKQKKHPEARAALREAMHIDPGNASARSNLAWLLLTGPPELRDPKEALTQARKAVELSPKSGRYFNTLGVAFYRSGQYGEAIPFLKKSLAASRGELDAFNLFFLAMCHARLGHQGEASKYRERASAWFSEHRGQLPDEWVHELTQFEEEAAKVLAESLKP